MLLLRILLTLFIKERGLKAADRADGIQTKKRLMLHKGIPDLATVKGSTGGNFTKLQQIFNSFDPIKGEKLSADPNKYQLITKTVIYKLPLLKTKESIADMVYVEFSLWFKHAYHDFKNKEAFIEAIYTFRISQLENDPFERNKEIA